MNTHFSSYAATLFILVSLTACGGGGSSTSTSPSGIDVTQASAPPQLAAQVSDTKALINDLLTFNAGFNESGVTYRWDFGDGSTLSGSSVDKRFASAGTFTVTVTATNSKGVSATAKLTILVQAPVVVTRPDNQFFADCSGLNCAATTNTSYAGSGLGIWRYHNSAAQDAVIDIALAGVTSQQTVTLSFTNGGESAAKSLPFAGSAVAVSNPPVTISAEVSSKLAVQDAENQKIDFAHSQITQKNEKLSQQLSQIPQTPIATLPKSNNPRLADALSAISVGSTRIWNDNFDSTPVSYAAQVHSICTNTGGRRIVFWVDPNVYSTTNGSSADVDQLMNGFCGTQGSYARTVGLIGDVWGSAANTRSTWLIQDQANALLDVNVVILQTPASSKWAGYFYSLNNYQKSISKESNEALAFFINGNNLKSRINYMSSTLAHELSHMIHFYQRDVNDKLSLTAWLEETSAMMTEDIVVSAVLPGYSKMAQSRIPEYLRTGGGVEYMNWPELSANNYNMGGTFGAFLNRRYGLSLYQQLSTGCASKIDTPNSYACLNSLIKSNGGVGLADELARMGASVFGGMPSNKLPSGYGFRSYQAGAYLLDAIDTASMSSSLPNTAKTLTSYTAATQTYLIDKPAAGKTSYSRKGVKIPAGTTLTVVVR